MPRFVRLGVVLLGVVTLTACGSSGSHLTSGESSRLASEALSYSRCMRSHGVTNFPDPSSGGANSYQGSTSSPAFTSAQSACARLAPRKVNPSSGHASAAQAARSDTKLIRWAGCMRHHGYPQLPDPKIGTPQPTPGFGTVLGSGAAYVQIPDAYHPHSGAFLSVATRCGINPRG